MATRAQSQAKETTISENPISSEALLALLALLAAPVPACIALLAALFVWSRIISQLCGQNKFHASMRFLSIRIVGIL